MCGGKTLFFFYKGRWGRCSGAGLQCEPLDSIWQVSHVVLQSLVLDVLQSPNLKRRETDSEAVS